METRDIVIAMLLLCCPHAIFMPVAMSQVNVLDSALEIPSKCGENQIVKHFAYTLSYNEIHEQADWVAYVLTCSQLSDKVTSRSDNFRVDPKVKTGSADLADYKGSGYDRGHLAPAADMAWSLRAMDESFFFSNMSPQTPSFNRGIWKHLEELMRTWANFYDTIFIATGPVLKEGLSTIGENRVSIPEYYYKVVLRCSPTDTLGIGFLLPNAASQMPLKSFAVSIDSVEKITGIDFFPSLSDEVEKETESNLCIPCWEWTNSHTRQNTPSMQEMVTQNAMRSSVSIQCPEMIKTGTRCKRMTASPNGKCFQHDGN
ncbi:MAG: DNA/RNA non-specific endonuclease [Bacteroidales bacterium]|nr:DNA/RNA non-specific endonuclease [Bacteroidales bacterium]